MKQRIAVVTGTRAEYGLLYEIMKQIQESSDFELHVIVTGSHLSYEYGYTVRHIVDDGFPIAAKVEMLLSSDSPAGIAKSIGLGVIGFADAFARINPDLLVLLGDRYEILAAAQAAMPARIPIAHIHGGEVTEGAFDEGIRHAITKLAHLHFAAAEPYRRRIIQLGEQPDRVFTVGAIGLDSIARLEMMSKEQLEHALEFQLGEKNLLVTYHPVTLETEEECVKECTSLLKALDKFPEAKVIFTKPNADTHNKQVSALIEDYASKQPERVFVTASLGQVRYFSAIQHVDMVIGNSSSGLIEVPYFRKPTVNVGNRQKGRLYPASVIQCGGTSAEIEAAIRQAFSSEHQQKTKMAPLLFGGGGVSRKIIDTIRHTDLEQLLHKSFYDLPTQC